MAVENARGGIDKNRINETELLNTRRYHTLETVELLIAVNDFAGLRYSPLKSPLRTPCHLLGWQFPRASQSQSSQNSEPPGGSGFDLPLQTV